TVTFSCTAPTPSTTSISASWPTRRTTSVRFAVVKPESSTVSSYVPAGRLGRKYWPVASVTLVLVVFVSTCRTVTVAPGSTPPCWSMALPRSVARLVCAKPDAVMRKRLTTTTNEVGEYAFAAVTPGDYTIVATLQGFKSFERKNITSGTQPFLTLDFTMETGNLTEQVVVTAGAPLVETSNASTGEVLSKT